MIVPGSANPLLLSDDGYQIQRSVRLRSSASAYFSRTPGAAADRKKWTYSAWIKRGSLGTYGGLLASRSDPNNYSSLEFSGDELRFVQALGGAITANKRATALFRDPAAWYHIVAVMDTDNATAEDRFILYVNGVRVTSWAANSPPALGLATGFINSTTAQWIGLDANPLYFDGYIAEVNFVNAQALTSASFGETNPVTGVWVPKKYSGAYGTNGFYLNFADNSAATAAAIGKDFSGNGNNWTPSGVSVTAGATYDSMLDTPTLWADGGNGRGNYAVLNPIRPNGSGVFADGNLKGTSESGTSRGLCSTIALPWSDKWYMEWTPASSATNWFGVTANDFLAADINTAGQLSVLYYANGTKYVNGTNTAYGSSFTTQTIGVAFDGPGGTITFYRDNVSQGAITLPSATVDYVFCMGNAGGGGVANVANFGQRPFTYTPPSGFLALHTGNLAEPMIKKPSLWFDVKADTGANIKTVAEATFAGDDLVWIKDRANANNHQLIDTVRGTSAVLQSNSTGAETTYSAPAGSSVAWVWKEGATPGFDIVAYSGSASAQNIAHSLGVQPSMMIVKQRNAAGNSWPVWHKSVMAGNEYLYLNGTGAKATSATFWNNTVPTSSVFSVGLDSATNASGSTYIAYLFSEVAGFSKFGSFTGNGSADGPFVACGFRPAFVMVKYSGGVGDWSIVDTRRDTYNVASARLDGNGSSAETVLQMIDVTSSGFKVRTTNSNWNTSAGTHIFAAFAESPFKYALAR